MSEEALVTWSRSEAVPFPSVWSRFEHKDPKDPTVIRKFRIQDVTDDLVDSLLHLMKTSLVLEEPLLSVTNCANDPVSLEEFTALNQHVIKQKVSLVCLEEDSEGNIIKEDGIPVVAGYNLLAVTTKMDSKEEPEGQGVALNKVSGMIPLITQKIDVLEKYNVDAYISGVGLSVDPNFRGLGIGLALLKARDELARAVGIDTISTIFSAEISQALAVRAGYETISEMSYAEIEKQYPDVSFAGIKTKSGKYMIRRIQ